jgi:pilus assembly protein CpaF
MTAVDERLVEALCRAAEWDDGDADTVVRAHVRRLAPLATAPESERLVRAAVARLDGLGSLDALLRDDDVDEILVNAGGDIWVERDGATSPAGSIAAADLAVVIERILAPLGRRLDRTSPVVDARLEDGSRVCAVIPPIALDGACLSVRRFRDRTLPLAAFGAGEVADLLDALLHRRCNVLVSGATSSGKTSLLNTMLGRTEPGERIVVIEDTAELLPSHDHLVRLEARPATPDGLPAITLEQLVRTALRLRPDRLVVGEVRGSDVLLTHHASCSRRALSRNSAERRRTAPCDRRRAGGTALRRGRRLKTLCGTGAQLGHRAVARVPPGKRVPPRHARTRRACYRRRDSDIASRWSTCAGTAPGGRALGVGAAGSPRVTGRTRSR